MEEKTKRVPPIVVQKSTKDRLDSIKHTGQSYDGIINELIDEYEHYLSKSNEVKHE